MVRLLGGCGRPNHPYLPYVFYHLAHDRPSRCNRFGDFDNASLHLLFRPHDRLLYYPLDRSHVHRASLYHLCNEFLHCFLPVFLRFVQVAVRVRVYPFFRY